MKCSRTDQSCPEIANSRIEGLSDEGLGEGVAQSSETLVTGQLTTHGSPASHCKQAVESLATPRFEPLLGRHQDKDRLAGRLTFERLLERELPQVDFCQAVALETALSREVEESQNKSCEHSRPSSGCGWHEQEGRGEVAEGCSDDRGAKMFGSLGVVVFERLTKFVEQARVAARRQSVVPPALLGGRMLTADSLDRDSARYSGRKFGHVGDCVRRGKVRRAAIPRRSPSTISTASDLSTEPLHRAQGHRALYRPFERASAPAGRGASRFNRPA